MALACAALLAAGAVPAQDAMTGAQALRQIHDKRAVVRNVELKTAPTIRIGQDRLEFTVTSGKPGFVYVLIAGADNKTLTVLFPNRVDMSNRIAAGQDLKLPRPAWPLKAGGPAGKNRLLVMVTDGPRNLSSLTLEGPFLVAQNDADGREKLYTQILRSGAADNPMCSASSPTKDNPLCSNAYGSAMATVEEVQ